MRAVSATFDRCQKLAAVSLPEMLQTGDAKRLAWKSLRVLRVR